MVVATAIGAGSHRDNPARLGHLVINLAQRRCHLVDQGAGHNHDVRLARTGSKNPTPLDDDAISEGSDAAQTSVADDSPEPPADYARVDDSGTETAETVSADTESVAGTNKDADEDVAAVSADEVTPGENVTAKATDAEQQAVADETETDSTRKT